MPTDTATPTGLMTIGAFSQATRLSLKALRLYDQLGLLPPARVDEATGYRYYAPEQVEAARLVFLLRQLGMPLQKIAAVLGRGAGTRCASCTTTGSASSATSASGGSCSPG